MNDNGVGQVMTVLMVKVVMMVFVMMIIMVKLPGCSEVWWWC